MSKRSKACEIKPKVRAKVWTRDNHRCVLCGIYVSEACSNAHYIARSHSGLGIEQNILTLCPTCHHNYDNTDKRHELKEVLKRYLSSKYENWNEEDLIYKKWRF